MSRRDFALALAAALAAVLFVGGLVRILLLRYERGDIYPASSTLRTDPLGTRALYEALAATGSYRVVRGLTSLHRELEDRPNTLFFVGTSRYELEADTPPEIALLSRYVWEGGRVVVTLAAGEEEDAADDTKKSAPAKTETKKSAPPASVPAPGPTPEKPVGPETRQQAHERGEFRQGEEDRKKEDPTARPQKFVPSLSAAWGFGIERHRAGEKKDTAVPEDFSAAGDPLAIRTSADGVEARVPWKSADYFVRVEPAWHVLYRVRARPVLMTRAWGRGEIVVATDSYFLSNEALRSDRRPRLLQLVAGPPGTLVFDETHLGTQEKEGVMVLAERYRFTGWLAGLLVVAALFLWRQSVPLAPPRAAEVDLGGAVSGKDSRSGLVNLLRRHLPPRDLPKTCFAEWKRSRPTLRGRDATRAVAMEAQLAALDPARPGDVLETYRQLCQINTDARTHEIHAAQS